MYADSFRIAFGVILGGAVLICAGAAFGQDSDRSRHYTVDPGCPWTKADRIPEGITLKELHEECFTKQAPPVPMLRAGIGEPEYENDDENKLVRAIQGLDIYGNDIARLEDVTLNTCLSGCRTKKGCKGFSYDKWNRMCHLKNRISNSVKIEPKSIAAVMTNDELEISEEDTVMQMFMGREFLDKPFKTLAVRDFDSCKLKCDSTKECEVFTYVRKSKRCKMIARPEEYFPSETSDSGVKRHP